MGRRFREARLNCNMKVIDVAKILGVVQSTVSAWEGERKEPPYDTVKKMAELYHVSVEYLLGYDSFEMLSSKEKIPRESIELFHSKPVWVQGKGWALVNAADGTLVYANESPEKIGDDAELYFAPGPYIEPDPRTDDPLSFEDAKKQNVLWVEPISTDYKLRDLLRGRYECRGEYVENARGSRFHFDNYGAGWLAFIIE